MEFYSVVFKLLNNPFASCAFTNLNFLIPHTAHFNCIIILPFLVLEIFESTFSVFSALYTISQHVLFYKIQSIKN